MIKLSYHKGGKVSTGQWENVEPHVGLEVELPNGENFEQHMSDLKQYVNRLFDEEVANAKGEKPQANAKEIAKLVKNMRFYEHWGQKIPSVTSIINYKSKISEYVNITPLKLAQLASRGSIIHKQIEVYIKTKEWCEPETIAECEKDLSFLEESNAEVSFDDVDFRAFEAVYPMEYISTESFVLNLEHLYAGRQDIKCIYNGLVTLADIKTGTMTEERKLKTFAQLSAYANTDGNKDVEQLMIIPLNHRVKQGYSKAIVDTEIEKHFYNFLAKRKQLKQELGV